MLRSQLHQLLSLAPPQRGAVNSEQVNAKRPRRSSTEDFKEEEICEEPTPSTSCLISSTSRSREENWEQLSAKRQRRSSAEDFREAESTEESGCQSTHHLRKRRHHSSPLNTLNSSQHPARFQTPNIYLKSQIVNS